MRQHICFDMGWRFHLGDIPVEEAFTKPPMYIEAKTERKRTGPASRWHMDSPEYYNETGPISHELWQSVDLPHDYIISQAPSRENNNTLGFFRYENAWYRKHFVLDAADEGRRVRLYFEGIAVHCKVYVNGCYMRTNNCGYSSFEVDITDVVDFGEDNVVAVYIDTTEHEGWWYEGAGIYRHVWLDISEPVSVDRYGVFVHPEKGEGEHWRIPVDTELRNDGFADVSARVETRVLDGEGRVITSMEGSVDIPARKHAVLSFAGEVDCPSLWDVDAPVLYTLETTVYADGSPVDMQRDRFGFRTFCFDPNEGFFLNGRNLKIKGVCCHQDYGLTGKAVPERVQRYRLELLKEMGANGYRCAHYPQHAYTMDMLDELGFLVLAETRWYESTPEGMEQLDMLIKRDRNRPGVIFWSAGNEEPMHLTGAGRRTAQSLLHRMRELDPTRPATTAVSHSPEKCPVMDTVDVIGVNYNLESWDLVHAQHPDKPFISTECCATGTTRGWYLPNDPARGYIYGYDRDTNKSFLGREKTWQNIMARPWMAGGYQWAGIEHRGETVWPRLCSQSGAIDLYLQRKDAFYQNMSHWTEKPMVHILPHWNQAGREGENIRVSVYTNCDAAELFLNGSSLGRRDVPAFGHAEWQVPYMPGCVKVVGYRSGEAVCEESVETTGAPVALRLHLERGGVRADGRDVAIITCDCVDGDGRHVPDAAPMVSFYTNEYGAIAGTGSDVCDHVPVTCPDRRMRAGLISVLVRAGNTAGTLRVYAHAEGLVPARLDIELMDAEA